MKQLLDDAIGDWDHISMLKENFKLMIDLVINHISTRHSWFQEFINGNPLYRDYFIWYEEKNLPSERDLRKIFRPRATPLLKKYDTAEGTKYVWTTFPLNQVDLNFKNEKVLLEILNISNKVC